VASLLRAVRLQRGLTLEALAKTTGVTKSYLSKIERQHSVPSIAVAMNVARALDIDVAQLFSEDPEVTTLAVDRAEVRGDHRHQALASTMLGKSMSPFIVRPGRDFAAHPHPDHAGQEFVFVVSGAAELKHGEQLVALDTGDCAYFDATIPHALRRTGRAACEVLVVAEPGHLGGD
jgi:transcriptional regulator with XRE-family HTH domain